MIKKLIEYLKFKLKYFEYHFSDPFDYFIKRNNIHISDNLKIKTMMVINHYMIRKYWNKLLFFYDYNLNAVYIQIKDYKTLHGIDTNVICIYENDICILKSDDGNEFEYYHITDYSLDNLIQKYLW